MKILNFIDAKNLDSPGHYSEVVLQHVPVMLNEVVEFLDPAQGDIIVDGTIGCGGHARAILEKVRPSGRLIGIDQDQEAIDCAKQNLIEFSDSLFLANDNFKNLGAVLKSLEIEKIDGILLDLGVSSLHMDTPERGFGIKSNAPLDMRMDRRNRISAFELVNNLPFEALSKILSEFGEERFHARIAKAIVEKRKKGLITTTGELSDIVVRAQAAHKFYRIHPATRTFQAFRIAVNGEIDCLRDALEGCVDHIKPGGRICVLSYHSIEDRVVKHGFRNFEKEGLLKRLTKKPLRPSLNEIARNPRSRSAKLRVAERQ